MPHINMCTTTHIETIVRIYSHLIYSHHTYSHCVYYYFIDPKPVVPVNYCVCTIHLLVLIYSSRE